MQTSLISVDFAFTDIKCQKIYTCGIHIASVYVCFILTTTHNTYNIIPSNGEQNISGKQVQQLDFLQESAKLWPYFHFLCTDNKSV